MKPNTNRGPVLVTGAQGRLGIFIVSAFRDRDVIAHTRQTLDVTSANDVARAVAESAPAVIVNCASFNDVDGAESQPVEALEVNAFAVRNLARAAADAGATLVHYSTDFVFDGRATEPYTEDVPPAPAGVYAASKLLGEWFALEAPGAFVLRVESLFGSPPGWSGRRGSFDGVVDGLRAGREVKVFTDRVVSPSYMPDIAAATEHLVNAGAAPGIYHCVNTGHATWAAVAAEAARVLGVTPHLVPVTMAGMRLTAARPVYCALANDKLAGAGFPMPSWQDALRRWLAAGAMPIE